MEEEKKEEGHEHHEHHEHIEHVSKKNNFTEKVRENPWMLGTLVLSVLVIALLVLAFSGGLTGNTISINDASKKVLSFYEAAGIQDLTLNSTKEVSGLYQVNLNYKGSVVPVYMTKDGKNIAESLIPTSSDSNTDTNTQTTEVPKSDKPEVELYVFTYCPYGTQMEKATIPVVKLFGDKIDFKIRQIGAMHGDFEKIEAQRQLCIQKNYPSKLLDYILAFDNDATCSTGDSACVVTKTTSIYTKLGIDASKINSCMTTDGVTMYDAEVTNANSKGIGGSPTLVINGVETQASRSPEEVKGVICAAFNNVPSECSQKLSTEQASAGFGSGTSSESSTASC
jgi:hypothetical protein